MTFQMAIKQIWNHKAARRALYWSLYSSLAMYATLTTIVIFFMPPEYLLRPLVAAMLLFFIAVGIFRGFPRIPHQYFRHNTSVSIVVGDLFEQSGSCVIGMSSTFDTQTSSGIISASSVQGQFLERIYSGNSQRLDGDLGEMLAEKVSCGKIAKPGNSVRYPIGTVVSLPKEGGGYWHCLAYTDLDANNVAHSSIATLWEALNSLWREVDQVGNGGSVAIPLIGRGQARISGFSAEMSLYMIVFSFVLRSHQSRFCEELRIIIPPADVSKVDIAEIRQFLYNMSLL